jgi:hypothetical protein
LWPYILPHFGKLNEKSGNPAWEGVWKGEVGTEEKRRYVFSPKSGMSKNEMSKYKLSTSKWVYLDISIFPTLT